MLEIENCGSCNNKNICGGCRARAYTYLNDVQAPDSDVSITLTNGMKLKTKSMEFKIMNILKILWI